MALTTKSFSTLVTDQATAIQSKLPQAQFPVGSLNLAMIEANAGVGLWLQGICLQVAALTRASSSTGTDLDSWMAQFDFVRNAAVAATGNVTFSRTTATNSANISVGTQVETQIGNIVFEVIPDATNPYFNSGLNAYVIPPLTNSISVPVIAQVAGASGNVNSNQINLILSPIAYIDSVNNPLPFTNGRNAESDADFRARFIIYINSLYAGTSLAYANAIEEGNPGIIYNVIENQSISGSTQLGFVTVVIDDGSGAASPELITKVTAQINKIRALAIQFGVYAVTPVNITIDATVTINPSYSSQQIQQDATNNMQLFFSELSINQDVIYGRIYQVIYDSSAGITDVTFLNVNSGTVDIPIDFKSRGILLNFNLTIT